MLSPGDVLTIDVEKPAVGGAMIGRSDGQVVLIEGAIPGERVSARIDRVERRVAYATVAAVETASPDRRPAVDPTCGGCLYAHVSLDRQRILKSEVIADAFRRLGKLELPTPAAVATSPEAGYRMRARLHVRNRRIGFYREGSHELCDPRVTRQLLPSTCDVLDRLAAGFTTEAVPDVRELDVSENVAASERSVHIVGGAPERLAGLARTDGITGLSGAPDHASGINVLAGMPFVIDRITVGQSTVDLRRHVLAFFQGNRFLLADLAGYVASLVTANARVIDWYAGGGLFALAAAAARSAKVIAVEGDPIAAADLAVNSEQAGGAVEAVAVPVERFARPAGPPADILIVDPPRTGLSKEAAARALALQAPRIVYVSCDVATLARDARRIVDAGYHLVRVDGFDLFPNTPHVEIVAVFDR